ncbi:MAG: putative hydrolase [Gemmatimonadetes bacterium]|nr:putative hydrolase [Gemmatimonadota bacterium]
MDVPLGYVVRMTRDDFIAYRRSLGRTPALDRMTVRVRGLDLAVWTSPPVAGVPPLVLVNGGLLYDHALLWPALSPLATGRQVILYDQRGRGASQVPPTPLDARIEDDAEDIGALRRALGIRQWDVLGHSWGGGIAMLGCVRDLAGTRRLVTLNAVGPTSAWMEELHANALSRLDGENRATAVRLAAGAVRQPDPAAQAEYARAVYPAWFADSSFATYFTPPEAASPTGAAVLARLRREGYDWLEQLRALSTHALVIHGERDALPVMVATELAALLPRARLTLISDAGHMPFWEAPERLFPVVSDFLAAGTTGPPRSKR